MAISVNWSTRIISVPQADLTALGGGIYQLDANDLRLAIKDLEDDETGIVFPDATSHNTAVTLAGVTYARTISIINGYTVLFENGIYTVKCVGANHNIGDVKVVNSVSLLIGNSAGLVQVSTGSGLSDAQNQALIDILADTSDMQSKIGTPVVTLANDIASAPDNAGIAANGAAITALQGDVTEIFAVVNLLKKYARNKRVIWKDPATSIKYLIFYDNNGTTEILRKALKDPAAADITDLAVGSIATEEASSV